MTEGTKQSEVQFVYAIFDAKAEQFLPPMIARTDEEAKRIIIRLADQDGMLKRFPADYVLWRLGTMDTSTGFLTAANQASLVGVKSLLGGEGA